MSCKTVGMRGAIPTKTHSSDSSTTDAATPVQQRACLLLHMTCVHTCYCCHCPHCQSCSFDSLSEMHQHALPSVPNCQPMATTNMKVTRPCGSQSAAKRANVCQSCDLHAHSNGPAISARDQLLSSHMLLYVPAAAVRNRMARLRHTVLLHMTSSGTRTCGT
jgi:hypothetical protein